MTNIIKELEQEPKISKLNHTINTTYTLASFLHIPTTSIIYISMIDIIEDSKIVDHLITVTIHKITKNVKIDTFELTDPSLNDILKTLTS